MNCYILLSWPEDACNSMCYYVLSCCKKRDTWSVGHIFNLMLLQFYHFFHDNPHNAVCVCVFMCLYMHLFICMCPCEMCDFLDSLLTKEDHAFSLKVNQREIITFSCCKVPQRSYNSTSSFYR